MGFVVVCYSKVAKKLGHFVRADWFQKDFILLNVIGKFENA